MPHSSEDLRFSERNANRYMGICATILSNGAPCRWQTPACFSEVDANGHLNQHFKETHPFHPTPYGYVSTESFISNWHLA